jgi:hypothetical protein
MWSWPNRGREGWSLRANQCPERAAVPGSLLLDRPPNDQDPTTRLLSHIPCPSHTYSVVPGIFLGQDGYPVLASYWFARLCVRANVNWWIILSYGRSSAIQRELTGCLPFPSCFQCYSKFQQADCSVCHLLSH